MTYLYLSMIFWILKHGDEDLAATIIVSIFYFQVKDEMWSQKKKGFVYQQNELYQMFYNYPLCIFKDLLSHYRTERIVIVTYTVLLTYFVKYNVFLVISVMENICFILDELLWKISFQYRLRLTNTMDLWYFRPTNMLMQSDVLHMTFKLNML